MKIIYLIRHSGPFVDIENYEDCNSVLWEEYNRNMILSVDGEKNAEKLGEVEELQSINEIYASNSVRAIATAKYIADKNNIKVKLDDRINERVFGIDYLNELPDNFNKMSFDDKNFKLKNGESFNDVDRRFGNFINEILSGSNDKTVVVVHGLILLSYLQTLCNFNFDGRNFEISFNNNIVLNGTPKNPDIYKLVYDETNVIINVENV